MRAATPGLIVPTIFRQEHGVVAAMTLRGVITGTDRQGYNLSISTGDDRERVLRRRANLASHLGFATERLALQRQVHGTVVAEVGQGYTAEESDALFTLEAGWLLGVSVADCVPVLVFDPETRLVGGIHSGWRGTVARIVEQFMEAVAVEIGAVPGRLLWWVGPSAGPCCYVVGEEVAEQFDRHRRHATGGGKFLLDNRGAVVDQLLGCGVQPSNLEVNHRCTICDPALHSYRRDGASSGRMLAVIGRRDGKSRGRAIG